MQIELCFYGRNTEHSTDFVVNRNNGNGFWLLMCFQSSFVINTVNGIEKGVAGDCILHDPNFAQYHRSADNAFKGFINSWVHFNGTDISTTVDKYQIPLNTIIHNPDVLFISQMIQEIDKETIYNMPFKKESYSNIFENMFLHLGRCAIKSTFDNNASKQLKSNQANLEAIRLQMLEQYQKEWTIAQMSEMAHLCPSRFSVLYKELFHNSPINELLEKRIHEAQIALLGTDVSIKELAFQCGFSSLYYFSRIFRKITGVSPSSFKP